MTIPEEILIIILQYCDYSIDLRCNKQFNRLTSHVFDHVFHHNHFIDACVKADLNKVSKLIIDTNSETINEAYLITTQQIYGGSVEIRLYLINDPKFDPFYNNSSIPLLLCKANLRTSLRYLLCKFKYDSNIIKECFKYTILNEVFTLLEILIKLYPKYFTMEYVDLYFSKNKRIDDYPIIDYMFKCGTDNDVIEYFKYKTDENRARY
jgi:hypothetical protein